MGALAEAEIERVLHECESWIAWYARKLRSDPTERQGLEQEGRVGALLALRERYDPARGVLRRTFAYDAARGVMLRYLRDRGRTIRMPAWAQEARLPEPDLCSLEELQKTEEGDGWESLLADPHDREAEVLTRQAIETVGVERANHPVVRLRILRLLMAGWSQAEVARKLGCSLTNICVHRRAAARRLKEVI